MDVSHVKVVLLLVINEYLAVAPQAHGVFAPHHSLNGVLKACQSYSERLKFLVGDVQRLDFEVRDRTWVLEGGLNRVKTLHRDDVRDLLEPLFELKREAAAKLAFRRKFAELQVGVGAHLVVEQSIAVLRDSLSGTLVEPLSILGNSDLLLARASLGFSLRLFWKCFRLNLLLVVSRLFDRFCSVLLGWEPFVGRVKLTELLLSLCAPRTEEISLARLVLASCVQV